LRRGESCLEFSVQFARPVLGNMLQARLDERTLTGPCRLALPDVDDEPATEARGK